MVDEHDRWQSDGRLAVENPLVRSVQYLPPSVKVAMYHAASCDTLRRRTWRGCPLNRAGCELGLTVVTERDAMQSFTMHRQDVRRFLLAWDYLRGTDEQCTTERWTRKTHHGRSGRLGPRSRGQLTRRHDGAERTGLGR